jgi:hypothetical protein
MQATYKNNAKIMFYNKNMFKKGSLA